MNSKKIKVVITLLSVLLLTVFVAGSTLAWLSTETEPIENQFSPGAVNVQIEETFNGTVKKNVTVTNTGSTAAYVRVKLVTYRVNADGQNIGGMAEIPAFTLGDGWFESNGIYYYKAPVEPGKQPKTPLIGDTGIQLTTYTDANGGKQQIDVIAEAIQAEPAGAVEAAWYDVTVSNGIIAAE